MNQHRNITLAALVVVALALYAAMPRASAQPAVAQIPAASAQRPDPGLALIGHVDEVIDGDTLDVSITYTVRIRLLDCWAPESRGASRDAGMAAKSHLIRLAADKDCVVQVPMGVDVKRSLTLDRFLGRVWLAGDDTDLSTHQVRAGHATRTKGR